jgi:hypothetical protein
MLRVGWRPVLFLGYLEHGYYYVKINCMDIQLNMGFNIACRMVAWIHHSQHSNHFFTGIFREWILIRKNHLQGFSASIA